MANQVCIKIRRDDLHRILCLRDDVIITQLVADERGNLRVLVNGPTLYEIKSRGVAPDVELDSKFYEKVYTEKDMISWIENPQPNNPFKVPSAISGKIEIG